MKRALFIILVFFAALLAACAEQSRFIPNEVQVTGLTSDQAKQLLIMVLKHEKYQIPIPGVFISGDYTGHKRNLPHTGYFDFSAGYDIAEAGATEYLGLFVVSKMTGDIWEINSRKRYKCPELQHAQALIMRQTGKSFADEEQARRDLGCVGE